MTWLTGWTRRKIKVVNGLTIPDYQMKLIVHKSGLGPDSSTDIYLGGHCRDDFADLRFTDPDQVTLLSYWIESITSGVATVWIKIPTLFPINNIYIYYDNPIASSISSGSTTFMFFDDFSGDLSKWTVTGTASIVSGELRYIGNGVSWDSTWIRPTVATGKNTIMEWESRNSALMINGSAEGFGRQTAGYSQGLYFVNNNFLSTYISNGNFLVPTGVTQVFITAWAGGGGGASGNDCSATTGGGGSGEVTVLESVNVSAGDTINITIGAGGLGGGGTGGVCFDGANGGNTTFGSLLSVEGGKGGMKNGYPGCGGGVLGGCGNVGLQNGIPGTTSGYRTGGGSGGSAIGATTGGTGSPMHGYVGGAGADINGRSAGGGAAGYNGAGGAGNFNGKGSASANSGAGGGGTNHNGGGGDGGSGELLVYYMQSYQRLDATETVLNDSFFNTSRNYKIVLPPGNGFSLYKDGVLLSTNSTWTNSNGADRFGFSQLTNAAYTYIKNARVRKYASPEPTFGVSGNEESPTCPTTTKNIGNILTLQATPIQGVAPYTVEFRRANSENMVDIIDTVNINSETYLIPIERFGGLSNPVYDVTEGFTTTRLYTIEITDINDATSKVPGEGSSLLFATKMIDSCTPSQSCVKYCKVFVACSVPVCDFTVT